MHSFLVNRHFVVASFVSELYFFVHEILSGRKCLVVAHEFTLEGFLEIQGREIWNDSSADLVGCAKLASNLDMVLW